MSFKIRIKSWNAVAAWTWGMGDDVCGICQNPIDGLSSEGGFPGEEESISKGSCSHVFHRECIDQWLSTSTRLKQCPLCRRDWKTENNGDGGEEVVMNADPSLPQKPSISF
mmetsp:Transcript_13028/g.23168  ORF Transcript_13028/g.23168 Transcript_13028/m.23168 type:complete len:111 (+) Transcript_13028:248-580(+)